VERYKLLIDSFTIHDTRSALATLAAAQNHVYTISPRLTTDGDTTQVWAF
jgi:hypothetical protein